MKRFDIQLFITHPDIDPQIISRALHLEPTHAWRVGQARATPAGRTLAGVYQDTRWRFTRRCQTEGQGFSHEVEQLLGEVESHASFLRGLVETGGTICLMVALLGDGYFGESLSPDLLARMAALRMAFGLESFMVPQAG